MNNFEVNADINPLRIRWDMDRLSSKKVEYVEVCTLGRKGRGKGSCMHLTIAL